MQTLLVNQQHGLQNKRDSVFQKEQTFLAAECEEVGPKEPLTREKLSPVIAVLKAEDTEDGLTKARQNG